MVFAAHELDWTCVDANQKPRARACRWACVCEKLLSVAVGVGCVATSGLDGERGVRPATKYCVVLLLLSCTFGPLWAKRAYPGPDLETLSKLDSQSLLAGVARYLLLFQAPTSRVVWGFSIRDPVTRYVARWTSTSGVIRARVKVCVLVCQKSRIALAPGNRPELRIACFWSRPGGAFFFAEKDERKTDGTQRGQCKLRRAHASQVPWDQSMSDAIPGADLRQKLLFKLPRRRCEAWQAWRMRVSYEIISSPALLVPSLWVIRSGVQCSGT